MNRKLLSVLGNGVAMFVIIIISAYYMLEYITQQFSIGLKFFDVGSHAVGVIAIGPFAKGIICLGQFSFGFVCVSQFGFGLLVGIHQIGGSLGFGSFQIGIAYLIEYCQFGIAIWRVKYAQLGLSLLSPLFNNRQSHIARDFVISYSQTQPRVENEVYNENTYVDNQAIIRAIQNNQQLNDILQTNQMIQQNFRQAHRLENMQMEWQNKIILQNLWMDFVQKNKHLGEAGYCTVCLSEIVQNEYQTFLPCFHSFHFECLTQWLVKNPSCPVCKLNIKQLIKNSFS